MIESLGGHAATAEIAKAIPKIDVYSCAKYILKEGTKEEKRDILCKLKTNLLFKDGYIIKEP